MAALAAVLSLAPGLAPRPALAQSQGPSTSGGNLPYIASGQSEDEIQKRKRARAEAEEKARQETARAAEEQERARQEAARTAPPTAQPEPVAPAATATVAPAIAPSPAAEPAKPKVAARPRPADLPPGIAAEPRVAPQQPRTAMAPQPQSGVVIVRRPMFFGLFGPEVNVTERVVVMTPPANVGSSQAAPRPPAAVGGQRVVTTRRPADNCHYHAYQASGMGYAHRDIQCHWHQDAGDPSLRYVD